MLKGRFHNPYFARDVEKKQHRKRDLFAIIGSLILLSIIVWFVFFYWHFLSVQTIIVKGQQYLTEEDISSATAEGLQQRQWLIFKQKFLPFLDKQQLSDSIAEQLSHKIQLRSILVEVQWPKTVIVTVSERVPGYVYINDNSYYYLDVEGTITQTTTATEVDPHFPHIRERNKQREITVGESILSPGVMEFISEVNDKFTLESNLDISEYAIMPVTCQAKQFVTEKIFADEIAGSTTESAKQKKRDILDQLRSDTITVDQSLDLLEEIKKTEGDKNSNEAFIKLAAEYKKTPCDYPTVIQDIIVVTQDNVEVYLDSKLDLATQLNNLNTVISDEIKNPASVDYIDVRFPDRVYYK
ncbi:MAG: hypothetical protein WCV88_00195 [Patescibacteria group bacterium]